MIREATKDDVEDLARLFDDYRVFYDKESDREAAVQFLTERLSNQESVIYLAFDSDNIMVGFVQLYPLFSSTRVKRLWLLNDLYVNANCRGKGFGEALLEKAKEFAKDTNACGLMLETAKTNIVGNNLYIKSGWVLDEEHNFYSWK